MPADYDGDGRADLAVYLPGTATRAVAVVHPELAPCGLQQCPSAASGHVPVPADYDGDGRADVAVYQPGIADGLVAVVHPGLAQRLPPGDAFGGAGHVPAPRDYDNDGRADFATFEPETAQWFIRFSSNDVTGSTQFGAPGDVPLAAPLQPYRLAVATAPAPAVRSAGVAPAPPAALQAAVAPPATATATVTPEVSARRLDFGQTAVQLASGSRRGRRRARPGVVGARSRPPARSRSGRRPAASAAATRRAMPWPAPWKIGRAGSIASSPASADYAGGRAPRSLGPGQPPCPRRTCPIVTGRPSEARSSSRCPTRLPPAPPDGTPPGF